MIYKFRPGGVAGIPTSIMQGANAARVHYLVICTQLALLLLLYGQTHSFDYIYFDDNVYVLDNPDVRAGLTMDGVRWAFTSFYASNWHPLTWLSHMLDVSLFGIDPGWAHLHNGMLHGVNSLLVYGILLKISGSWWKAYILSLVFLVHPLHVESVAWIAERKDLLCAFFFLLGLLLYDSYRARPGKLRYAGILATYSLALLAKPMAVTFPIVLLILDLFVYRRYFQVHTKSGSKPTINYRDAIVEKLPLLGLAIAMSAVTIAAQHAGGAVAALDVHPFSSRWKTATAAYVIYLKQFLLPVDLVPFYPISESTSLIDFAFPGLILLVLVILSIFCIPTLPLVAAGLCWYLVTLLPVIGLVQVGSQSHADRYMYLPSVGILIACIYLIPPSRLFPSAGLSPSSTKKRLQLSNVLAAFIIAYLTMISYWQISYWENRNILFTRVLDVIGPDHRAHIRLAEDYTERGMLQKARKHSLAAIDIRPSEPAAYQSVGNIALARQDFEKAEKFYRLALSKGGSSAGLFNNFGIALAEQGGAAAGIEAFERALLIDPKLVAAQKNIEHYGAKMKAKATR